MLNQSSFSNNYTFFQKVRSIDYLLLFCIFIVGIISCLAMYSTDGGEFLYHTKNHALRFVTFFIMMIIISFINIKTWHSLSYLFLFSNSSAISMGIYVWNNSLRITKVDKFIFH